MIALSFVLVLGTPRTASADPAADAAAAAGESLAAAGKHALAAAKFREAWNADRQRPELFCNIGISYYRAADYVRAHLLLGQCIEQATLDPAIVQKVRAALISVEDRLRKGDHTPLRIVAQPSATSVTIAELGSDEAFVGSRVVWLPFGTYHVTAHAGGYVDLTETVTLTSSEPRTVTLALHKPEVAAPPDRAPPAALVRSEVPPPRRARSRVPAYLATGATVLALGVAAYAYTAGHARAELAADALDLQTSAADERAVRRWNTVLAISGSVAVGGAVTSGLLWYRGLRAGPVIHAGGAGVALLGRF